MKQIPIRTEFITLGQLLKVADCISSGGQAKHFLAETTVHVNGTVDQRRGRKLVPGDRVVVQGCGEFEVTAGKAD